MIVDTSAWIEYFRSADSETTALVDQCLARDQVGIGDLIYCELMQGIRSPRQRREVGNLLSILPGYEMVGFSIAEKAADNYRLLRSSGITVRKTIDVLIATFCVEKGFYLVHQDRDFDFMAEPLKLKIYSR